MKQILQSLRTGATELAEVPAPAPKPGHLLIRTSRTLVSAGTERMLALEQRFFLADHNLIYTDKMSMAAQLRAASIAFIACGVHCVDCV